MKNGGDEKVVHFDIVMNDAFPLDPNVYPKVTGLYQLEKGIVEFSREDDLLFVKWNGQLTEALQYRGDNTFEGGAGYIKAKFELLDDGGTKVMLSMADFDGNKQAKVTNYEGTKFLKY